jgi:hypothetical protein
MQHWRYTSAAMTYNPVLRAPLPLLALAFAGALAALAGGYWDDAWHTERGRDTFFIAPHIAIYAGIATAGAALALWALLAARRRGLSAVLAHRPLALALVSVAVTLASGPIDDVWHRAFGRDSVIWSPPHMLGIAGTLGLGAAILAELATWPQRWARALTIVAGALVLASAGFSTVEYDTDVPQFDEALYLPVLGFSASIGLLLVRAAAIGRWAATWSAAVYTAFIGVVGVFLTLVGFPPPALPLLVAPAIVVDVAAARRWPPLASGAAFAAALHAAYVPVRNWLGDGVRLDAADVLIGGALTIVAASLVFWLAQAVQSRARVPRLRTGAVAAVALATGFAIGAPPEARAHDPGQGEDAGAVALRLAAQGEDITLRARLPEASCRTTEPIAVIARRAGREVVGELTRRGCVLQGSVSVEGRGRWFVYALMRRDGEPRESWLPITVGDGGASAHEDARYAYVPPQRSNGLVKVAGGIVLYGLVLGLLIATFTLVARGGASRPA